MIRTFAALIGMALLAIYPVICAPSPLEVLGRQLMLQQLATQESVRSRGSSGLKEPLENILYDNLTDVRTVGLREFNAVLNGVEFRARQNSYTLDMPHTTSSEYGAVEPIPFPPVPQAVQDQPTIDDQIIEMREWFKAWDEQDPSERDYREYFKPVLCYLEGGWTTDVDEKSTSPVEGPHFLDVDDIGHSAYSPIAVLKMEKDTPVLAEWSYIILCHPLKRDLPLNRFQVVDDVSTRMREGLTLEELAQRPTARFQLTPSDSGEDQDTLLDELMAEIPGKDNYQGQLVDARFSREFPDNDVKPNAAYYHRTHENAGKDAQGSHSSGLSDKNLFVAQTSQSQVAGRDIQVCSEDDQNDCTVKELRSTYAIPLDIIYMTPLPAWNPSRSPNCTLASHISLVDFFKTEGEHKTSCTDREVMHKAKATGTRIHLPPIEGMPSLLRTRYPIMPLQ